MKENESSDSEDDIVRKTVKKKKIQKPKKLVNLDKLRPIIGQNSTNEQLMDLLFHCPYWFPDWEALPDSDTDEKFGQEEEHP